VREYTSTSATDVDGSVVTSVFRSKGYSEIKRENLITLL